MTCAGVKTKIMLLSIMVFIMAAGIFILATPASTKYTYLALGDSYTAGTGIRYSDNFPSQVVGKLRERHIDMGRPKLIAYSGWRTGVILEQLRKAELTDTFTFVSVLAGTNDQFGGWGLGQYKQQLEQLIRAAIKLTNGHAGRVIVLSLPDYSVTPFAGKMRRDKIGQELGEYNDVCKKIATAYGCKYIDITGLSRAHAGDATYLATDGLHLSAKGYAEWADSIADIMIAAL